jgi:AraC family transcriptional regulator of adaptative response/methylated-DNA-[protein]-cysteine methyltransferase
MMTAMTSAEMPIVRPLTPPTVDLADAGALWRAVSGRDATFDGAFVYAVTSTGVFCKPSCPSRRPRRDRVRFFADNQAARSAGFRACKRCRPDDIGDELVTRAIALLENACASDGEAKVPTLEELGRALDVSPGHLQRRFKAKLGVSPRAFADALRRAALRDGLRMGEGVAAAMYDAGYGSPSRIYEAGGARLGMTPATYARGGRGAKIGFAIADSPLDRLLVAATERGVCAVYLGDDDAALEQELRLEYPQADISADIGALDRHLQTVLAMITAPAQTHDLPLDVRASAFQAQVWEALRAVPPGETRTYRQLAETIGSPRGARAVGRACATNPVSVVVPCHRAVRGDGGLGGYRWGLDRKRALLSIEAGDESPAGSDG